MNVRLRLKQIIATAVLLVLTLFCVVIVRLRTYPASEATAEELAVLQTQETANVRYVGPGHYRVEWSEECAADEIVCWLGLNDSKEPIRFDGFSTIGYADLRHTGFADAVQPLFEIRLNAGQEQQSVRVVSKRLLDFDGVSNLRDIGGYRTEDGDAVKWKCVYRSSAVTAPSGSDLRLMSQLGLAAVIDLRTEEEAAQDPDLLPAGVKYIQFPIYQDGAEPNPFGAMLWHRPLLPEWQSFYDNTLLQEHGRRFGRLLRLVAETDVPVLIHCTAGKDRAGLAIALLLLTLGVPEEVVVSDYSLSNLFYEENLQYTERSINRHTFAGKVLGMRAEQLHQFLNADPRVMRSSLDSLKRKYGNYGSYLRQCLELDDDIVNALKRRFLEDGSALPE